jgi:DNA-binding transcriptional regulator YdaS (Cro superfamily)
MEKIIEWFGSQRALAAALGVTDGAVSQWVADGQLPPYRALQIERLTNGELKAVDYVSLKQ